METTMKLYFVVLITTAMGTGCGVSDFGVRHVEFDLAPAVMGALPPGFDSLAALQASGHVEADAVEDAGQVTVRALPVPPLGFDYAVMLMLAHDQWAELPGGSGDAGGGGHAHGALTHAAASQEKELETVALGFITTPGGAGSLSFSTGDLDGHEMGALRSGMLMIVPSDGSGAPSGMILLGGVGLEPGADADDEGGGGHEHGA